MAKRASYADAGWAALNLLTEPSEFDFSVALGAMPVGVRESESSTIRVFGPRETGVCRVHLTRERSERVPDSGGAPLCRVEVLSPLADESREFDLAEECIRQLELALRLFKPASFRLIPWKQRGELRALRTGPCYSLDQAELRRFREFSERLMALHVELKHYQWAQAIPEDTSDDVYELFGTSRSAIQETLGGAYLMIVDDAVRTWSSGLASVHRLAACPADDGLRGACGMRQGRAGVSSIPAPLGLERWYERGTEEHLPAGPELV